MLVVAAISQAQWDRKTEPHMSLIYLCFFFLCIAVFGRARNRQFRGAEVATTYRKGLQLSGNLCALLDAVWLAASAGEHVSLGRSVLVLLMFAGSLALFRWALRVHGQDIPNIAFTPGAPNTLKLTGPYRWVRHPIYSAYLLTWAAVAVGAPSVLSIGVLCTMLGWYISAAALEEREILASPLRAAYQEYRGRTGMFVPFVA